MDQSNFQIYSTTKDAWEAMYQAILDAKKSIYWELYIFVDDEAGKPFFDVLEQKAKAGVMVKLVIDNLGSFWLSKERVRSLRNAGVDIRFFQERKKRYRGWWKRLWTRSHRKILIVDERVGFIGGVNIRKEMKEWLDIQVRVEGRAVHSMLRAFAKNYIICGGDKKQMRHLLKYRFRLLRDKAEFVFDEPDENKSSARLKYAEALLKARERVILFSPYYFPDKKFLLALWQAKKRGVRVDLLIPLRSDIRLMTYASYAWFSVLKKLGVNIHFTKKMMHGKGVIMDDEWAMVGSSNMEQTGFYDNYEANIKIKDLSVVKEIKSRILQWLKDSMEFDEKKWAKRGVWHRLNEQLAKKLYKLWHGDK